MKNNGFLFGGALMAAGLGAQFVEADFIFLHTEVNVSAYHPNDPWGYEDYYDGPGPWSISASCDGVASSEGTADALRLLAADTGILGSVGANLEQSYFKVSEAATCQVSWDFGGGGDDFFLMDVIDEVVLVSVNIGEPVGTQLVNLEFGKLYFVRSGVSASKGIEDKFVDFVIVAPASCPWDLNNDDLVGTADLLLLLGSWGANPGGPPDFDGDGNVGASDLIELLGNWGPCP